MRCPAEGSLGWAGKLVISSTPLALAPNIFLAENVWSEKLYAWQAIAYCVKQMMWASTFFVANEINLGRDLFLCENKGT